MPKNHQPIDGQTRWGEAVEQREVVLPRTEVPEYLDETPLAVQERHVAEGNFDLDRMPQGHAGDSARFPRPSMKENLSLLESNLSLFEGTDNSYFDMPWRKKETLDG